ncbi:MAG TPA: prepilin-type N-terminal cleavage/methylation domain-containing protein [Chthoniobacterales bacterium]|nr:prepilin-type N-terminal cleavage/methylation domain-containing protein [Chthoniobacterales bacterium]
MSITPSLGRRLSAPRRVETLRRDGFTLIELLIVITIIAVLVGIAFPAYQGIQNRARIAQVKNDLTQLVTAVNAYFTDYGKYPLPAASQGFNEDFTYSYDGEGTPPNSDLIKILQNEESKKADNPRGVVFLSAPPAKADGAYGIQPEGASKEYLFLDPWGHAYSVCIDSDYNGKVREKGTGLSLSLGVITWSIGKDGNWEKSGIGSWK